MARVCDDLADLLSTGGITTTIYRGFLPDLGDEAIAIVETGGYAPVSVMSATPGNAVEQRPTVQVTRRSMTPEAADAEMQVIWRLLHGAGDRSLNGTRYLWIEAQQQPFPLPRDEAGRWLSVCNFMACKAVTTATST